MTPFLSKDLTVCRKFLRNGHLNIAFSGRHGDVTQWAGTDLLVQKPRSLNFGPPQKKNSLLEPIYFTKLQKKHLTSYWFVELGTSEGILKVKIL